MDGTQNAGAEGIDAYTVQVAQEALMREVNKFVAEVRRSFDYYLTQATQVRTIRRIYMTGGGAALANLASHLEHGLQAQVLLADPLSRVAPGSSSSRGSRPRRSIRMHGSNRLGHRRCLVA